MTHDPHLQDEPATDMSIGTLVSNVSHDLSTLMQQEVALAKAEIRQSAVRAGTGAGMLGGAGVAGHFVLLFASLALWVALADWFDNWGWSALVVAILWAVVAAILAAMGRKKLREVEGLPRTVDTAKQVPQAMKGNER